MAEALGIATDAYEALERFPSDEKVQSTIQILLGGDAHKVQRAKGKYHFCGISLLYSSRTQLVYTNQVLQLHSPH
jgi:hypothetical protein